MSLDSLIFGKKLDVRDEHFKDEEQRLYAKFLHAIKEDGIKLPLLFSDRFRQIQFFKKNEKAIESVKKAFEEHAKKQQTKKSANFDKIVFAGEELLESIPAQYFLPEHSLMNVITKEAQHAYSLRELIYDLYPLYADDKIELSISLHKKLLFKGSGVIKRLRVPTEVISSLEVPKNEPLMMTVVVKLLEGGDNRRRHEKRSNIFDVDAEREILLSKDYALNAMLQPTSLKDPTFKLNEQQFVERAKLFGVDIPDQSEASIKKLMDEWKPTDFGAKELTHLRDVYKRFYQYESNEQLLKFKAMLNLELEKTGNWLDRENADGFDGFYK